MTPRDLTSLHELLTARFVGNRLRNIKFDPELQLAELLLTTLQGSSKITATSFQANTEQALDRNGGIHAVIHRGKTYTFTIETWN